MFECALMGEVHTLASVETHPRAASTSSVAGAAAHRLLVMVDIEGMQAINAERGWQHGDSVIAAVQTLLRAQTPDQGVWQAWRGDKFLVNMDRNDTTLTWLHALPANLLSRIGVSVTVCVLAVDKPATEHIDMLVECMTLAKSLRRGKTYAFS